MRNCPPGHVPLERALSKLGLCSRSEARRLVAAGRVRVAGTVASNALMPVRPEDGTISIDGDTASAGAKRYLALNKPRGLVCTTSDERGRDTVYSCFADSELPWLAPVGRLDKASEGLLLFSNDTRWADAVLQPSGPAKVYHVHIEAQADDALVASLEAGHDCEGEHLSVHRAAILRHSQRRSWLELELHGGRNRHIRRLLAAHNIAVRRLMRVSIGPLALGELGKGAWRELSASEAASLAQTS
ncbi:MAG: pseudouridine synthase [Planctomycetota bacterium]|jgi:23S rRNA pseudouridine2605 synthase|nr:pseudouridine synthase [Planctomycetota bacterium]